MSLVTTIRKTLVPIHPEGHKFIIAFFAVSLILGFLWMPLFWVGMVLHRLVRLFLPRSRALGAAGGRLCDQPGRRHGLARGDDGTAAELALSAEPMLKVSIFMNVFNCHVNRTPMRGTVDHVVYREGKFLNADLDKASEDNERNGLVIDTAHGRIGVVQVAGLVARRIVCWVTPTMHVDAGQRIGLIRFGSRLDVYLPEGFTPRVTVGQTAIAGETVLAEFGSDKGPVLSRRL
jgi:phosphatidylserine decarboxylase